MTPLDFGPVLVRGASVQDDRFFPLVAMENSAGFELEIF